MTTKTTTIFNKFTLRCLHLYCRHRNMALQQAIADFTAGRILMAEISMLVNYELAVNYSATFKFLFCDTYIKLLKRITKVQNDIGQTTNILNLANLTLTEFASLPDDAIDAADLHDREHLQTVITNAQNQIKDLKMELTNLQIQIKQIESTENKLDTIQAYIEGWVKAHTKRK